MNLGGVKFFGWSIPSISQETSIWYLGIGSLGTGLFVQAADPTKIMRLLDAAAVRSSSLSLRSLPRFRLALIVSQRSVLEGVQLGDSLCLLNATDLLLLWLSRMTWDLRYLLF